MIIRPEDLLYVKKLKNLADIAEAKKPIVKKSIFKEIEKQLPINKN